MRGRWDLNEEELAYWQANAIGQTKMMQEDKIHIVDLTKENITPYQVNQVLTSLGWNRYNEFNGLEGDRYAFTVRKAIEILFFMQASLLLN